MIDIEIHADLIAYLRDAGRVAVGEKIECRTLAGGVSNKTVLVDLGHARAWVIKQALAKLRVKDEWFSDPARIAREAEGLRWLVQIAPAGSITPLVFEDFANHLLAMEAVPQPHDNLKQLFMSGHLSRPSLIDLSRSLGALLGCLHRRAAEMEAVVRPAFMDRSFFLSLRIDPYYRVAADREPAAASFLDDLINRTDGRQLTLTHGDFSPKNVLVRAGRLILLDHEVIHWGDPAFDVGFCMAHFLSKAQHFGSARGDYRDGAREFWASYRREISGANWADELETWCIRHSLGCLLARVRGKSQLEYLSECERDRQCRAAIELMERLPDDVFALIDEFLERTH